MKLSFLELPSDERRVRPWIADVLPEAFPDWQCEVLALELERSFWEKATILHAEYHRPADKPIPDRFSRHYADTAALAHNSDAMRAIKQHDLRDRVVAWKGQFFGNSWARYDLAKPGTFWLVPPAERIPALLREYEAMRAMYLVEPRTFEEVLAILEDLEQGINGVVDG